MVRTGQSVDPELTPRMSLCQKHDGGDESESCHHHKREREREMFYLPTHFYLRLYGVRHMVKDHSDSEKGNPLPPHRLLLSINCKGYFICTIPQTG